MQRRTFLKSAAAALTLAGTQPARAAAPATPSVCVFSKHLQFLDYDALAATGAELGIDGFDLTVRPGGHVLPENASTALPRAVEAIRAAGLDVPMITTALRTGLEDHAAAMLDTAAELGIRYARVGTHRYTEGGNPLADLDRIAEDVARITALAEVHGLTAGYHNHSGYREVAGPLWDLHHLIVRTDSPAFGSNFDVGHAAAEGSYGAWETNARLLAPYVKMMSAKDFVWAEGAERPRWVPLGEGRVPLVPMLTIMREAGFAGPISLHFEYSTESEADLLEHMRQAAETLRAALREAGYA